MAIIIEEKPNVTVRRELYAPNIRIIGNPEDTLAGAILLEINQLVYHDGTLEYSKPLESAGETIADFVQRSFDIDGKTITGIDVMMVVKRYVEDLHAEREASAE